MGEALYDHFAEFLGLGAHDKLAITRARPARALSANPARAPRARGPPRAR